VGGVHSCFRSFITAETPIPLHAYLAFHDELIRRFYSDDEAAHFRLGRESASWALAERAHKSALRQRATSMRGIVALLPELWRSYFLGTTSKAEAVFASNAIDFRAKGLPLWHPYLENFVVGYVTEVLEMFCASPVCATRVSGGGARGYRYIFQPAPMARTPVASQSEPRQPTLAIIEAPHYLSNREIEILLLVADGKTNGEIGGVLGISGKTAQHHVANAFRKIGVSSRVAATVWLARRGFIGN
jgi:DNA-binding CsgD family transcriptional regulator